MNLFNCKLNDFELDQLDLFLGMVEDKLSVLQNAINRAEEWHEFDMRTQLLELYHRQQASLMLLQVQLLNAKEDVRIISNVAI